MAPFMSRHSIALGLGLLALAFASIAQEEPRTAAETPLESLSSAELDHGL